jgi:putative transcriptional regulator
MLGCAGWGPLQLDNELNDNAWLTCAVSKDIVFSKDVDAKWERSMMLIGSE